MVKEGNKRHVKDTTLDLKPSKCKTAINYVFYLTLLRGLNEPRWRVKPGSEYFKGDDCYQGKTVLTMLECGDCWHLKFLR